MEHTPVFLPVFFALTTFITVWLFWKAAGYGKRIMVITTGWLILYAIIGLSGFFLKGYTMPPRFVFLIAPALVAILICLFTVKGRAWLDSLEMRHLTLLHVVRIPVEITLYFLFVRALVPESMTFTGANPDILSGLSAAVIFYLAFVLKKTGPKTLLVWNFSCLALLFNIVTIAILSAQTPFQTMNFDHPNIGIAYFPYVWLPSVIVPLVLLSHVTAIRQLSRQLKGKIPALTAA